MKAVVERANQFVMFDNAIMTAPGFDGLYVRHSTKAENNEPHLVTSVKTTWRFKCSSCPVYTSLKICEHSIAAAQQLGLLSKFLCWRNKQKHKVDTTEVFLSDVRSGMKGKPAKPRKGGRTPLEKQKNWCTSCSRSTTFGRRHD
jgi:hypothetical protein